MFRLFLSLVSGILLVFAFAPFKWGFLGFFAPAIFLYAIKDAKPKLSFWCGLAYGIGLFTVGVSWLYNSIHRFGNANSFLAGLITALFILLMSLYPATQGYFITKLFRNKSDTVKCLLIFPATYVIWEWLRSYLMTGFPWLFLGYTQTGGILSGYAPIFSVYGVSLAVAIISGCVCLFLLPSQVRTKLLCVVITGILLIVAVPLHHHHWTTSEKKPITVALVQGNIPQDLKWNPQKVTANINKYVDTTEKYWGTNLIIWPEAAVPITSNYATQFIENLNKTAKSQGSSLLFGIPIANTQDGSVYNGIMAVGNGQGEYLKRHLVPYGEYIPIPSVITPVMKYFEIPFSNLSKGPEDQAHLKADGYTIAPLICYEVVYPFLVIDWSVNANLLVTINDDSWFGDSFASPQQVQMAQMRSIETERYMLYSSNTGITAIINPLGDIIKELPENKLGVLTGTVYATTGSTPVMRWEIYPILIVLALMMIIGSVIRAKKKV